MFAWTSPICVRQPTYRSNPRPTRWALTLGANCTTAILNHERDAIEIIRCDSISTMGNKLLHHSPSTPRTPDSMSASHTTPFTKAQHDPRHGHEVPTRGAQTYFFNNHSFALVRFRPSPPTQCPVRTWTCVIPDVAMGTNVTSYRGLDSHPATGIRLSPARRHQWGPRQPRHHPAQSIQSGILQ